MREITYREAINEALVQAMKQDPRVFVMGLGVDDPKGVFGTTLGAYKKFGRERVFDTPLSENGMTGVGAGAALAGMRPVMVHQRNDFLLLAMDQIVNHVAKWRYMCGGTLSVPLTIRAIIGRGWGQAAQHSQSLQALFAHIPGLKVVMPATPYDAKGLLIASIEDDSPVICLEHRWLYEQMGPVPEESYAIPLGKGTIIRHGQDITVVAISYMVFEAAQAALELAREGIEAELIDLRSLRPLDEEIVFESVKKTGRLVVADTGWKTCGIGAEVAARAVESVFSYLTAPVRRITLPDVPTPCSPALEKIYYPGVQDIVEAVREVVRQERKTLSVRFDSDAQAFPERDFKGPF